MTDRPLAATLALAARARRLILAAARRLPYAGRADLFPLARRELERLEPLLARTVRDAQLIAWLSAAREQLRAMPNVRPGAEHPDRGRAVTAQAVAAERGGPVPNTPPPPEPPGGYFPDAPDDPQPVVRFPQVERAARWLATRLDYTPEEFAALDDDARAVGFTVARAVSLEAVGKVRRALEEDVARGGTLREFRAKVREAVGTSALGEAQIETIYRTTVARSYAAGQQDVLGHDLVRGELPYLLWSSVHDGRVRPEHLAFEHMGLNGTAVYRADDGLFEKWFPPIGWNCRCVVIPLSVEDAAARGVREAREWLRSGVPPAAPEWVEPPPFDLPKNWPPSGRRLTPAL